MPKKGMLYGLLTILLAAFILFIAIMQNNFKDSPEATQKGPDEIHMLKKKETNLELKNKKVVDLLKLDPEPEESKQVQKITEKTEKKAAKKQKIAPVTYSTKYVTVSSLNVRSGPSAQDDVNGVVTINQSLKVVNGDTTNGWVKVSTKALSGYVNVKYLSDEKIIVQVKDKSDNSSKEKKSRDIVVKDKATSKKTDKSKTAETATVKNDADKLTTIDANNQLILVTSNGYGTSSATIQTFERNAAGQWEQLLNVSGFIGKNGFGSPSVEGDGKSPTGKYSIGTAFGRSGNPGTKLPFRSISADDVWVDDSNSSLYNSWQSKKETSGQWSSAENMDIAPYTYGFVINFNTSRTPGKGSAIFFHIANGHTLGCTGVSQPNIVSILKWIDPAKNPVIIQTPESQLNNY